MTPGNSLKHVGRHPRYTRIKKKFLIMAKRRTKIDRKTKSDIYDKFSDFALDLAKLIFAGVILAGIMGMDVHIGILFFVGSLSVIILTLTAYIFIILKHNTKK